MGQTNQRRREKDTFHQQLTDEVKLNKGDFFGEFRLGSTLVLVFEAPEDAEFRFKHEERVKVGQGIVHIPPKEVTGEEESKEVLEEVKEVLDSESDDATASKGEDFN